MPPSDVTMRVWRGDAKGGAFKDFQVPAAEGMVVLDVIHTLQATQAPDLACRWNCKAGKCGSCSAEINGKPRLMCMTRMDTFEPGETRISSPTPNVFIRVMHMSFGWPLISALHEPHLPALQFHRHARSLALSAWIWWIASSTTMPSLTSVV